ncbi:hypothetical protein H696_00218 [Fonticula alba]|uniref:PPPDE domain-containing protein n=1 Tax=Fonticula alba TaxID=691883 RepID=A0A058ZFC3_FONAL|nr:hypothetical protein H696_00218 [Fonticula alba]KCV72633.1 hypothetical protein H696_00218 [Fonticula alba]|eukprot:XP_009492334.1 hypothetical protein H696_00218 [Fonticula alba]
MAYTLSRGRVSDDSYSQRVKGTGPTPAPGADALHRPAGAPANGPQSGRPVFLNVYDLFSKNQPLYHIGLGVFHSGVQILDREFCFGGHPYNSTGIFECPPRNIEGAVYRESILMGYTSLSDAEIIAYLDEMGSTLYTGSQYSLIGRNCNHFASEFATFLTGTPSPGWVNRLARFATAVPCLVPQFLIEPPTADFYEQMGMSPPPPPPPISGSSSNATGRGGSSAGAARQQVPGGGPRPINTMTGPSRTLGDGGAVSTGSSPGMRSRTVAGLSSHSGATTASAGASSSTSFQRLSSVNASSSSAHAAHLVASTTAANSMDSMQDL